MRKIHCRYPFPDGRGIGARWATKAEDKEAYAESEWNGIAARATLRSEFSVNPVGRCVPRGRRGTARKMKQRNDIQVHPAQPIDYDDKRLGFTTGVGGDDGVRREPKEREEREMLPMPVKHSEYASTEPFRPLMSTFFRGRMIKYRPFVQALILPISTLQHIRVRYATFVRFKVLSRFH